MVLLKDTISLSRDTKYSVLLHLISCAPCFLTIYKYTCPFTTSESSYCFQNVGVHYFSKWEKTQQA